jgi:hypothetical protein
MRLAIGGVRIRHRLRQKLAIENRRGTDALAILGRSRTLSAGKARSSTRVVAPVEAAHAWSRLPRSAMFPMGIAPLNSAPLTDHF